MDDNDESTEQQRWWSFTSRKVQSGIGIFLTLVALVSLFYGWRASAAEQKSNDQLRSFVTCQAEWTNFFYTAIQNNRNASQQATEALDNLIRTITTAKSREQSAAALVEYNKARTNQIIAQNENPLPAAPKAVCQLEDS